MSISAGRPRASVSASGISAPRPRPSAFFFMVEDFLCKIDVAFGAFGPDIIKNYRFTKTGRFGQTDVARDHAFEQPILEIGLQVGTDLDTEVGALIEHGQNHTLDGKRRVESVPNPLDGVEKVGDSFE